MIVICSGKQSKVYVESKVRGFHGNITSATDISVCPPLTYTRR